MTAACILCRVQKFIFVELTNKYYYKSNETFVIVESQYYAKTIQKITYLHHKNNVIENLKTCFDLLRNYIAHDEIFFEISSSHLIIKFLFIFFRHTAQIPLRYTYIIIVTEINLI